MKKLLSSTLAICLALTLSAQDYSNFSQIVQRTRSLADKYPDKVHLKSLAKTTTGKDIWVLELGMGQTRKHPAIAILGGVDGRHLLGVEMAMGLAESLLSQPDADSILSINTYYIFPNVQPDATEQYFAPLCYERTLNARPTDNDRDGYTGEDPYEDLNNDNIITKIRVESPKGTYIESPEDPRILIPANLAKGETGKYLIYSEGTDNDKDGLFNEDGEGGINFNRNFTYLYKNFTPESGDYAVSEIESRAVADFLYDAFNVHTVLSFSLNNNVSVPTKAYMTGPLGPEQENPNDSRINTYVSSLYNRYVPDMAGTETLPNEGGEFYTWGYQHYGRNSYATPAWLPLPPDKKSSGNSESDFLKWAEANDITDVFVPWTTINHPDFPNNKTEIGGIKPFVKYNPPYNMVPELIKEHSAFLNALTAAAPRITLVELKKEPLDKGITRLTLIIKNNGIMPTINQIGERSYFLKHITVQLIPSSGQTLLQGNPKTTKPVLNGGETAEFSWLVQGSGKISVEAGCPTAGYISSEITL